jgi:hypothetical protein
LRVRIYPKHNVFPSQALPFPSRSCSLGNYDRWPRYPLNLTIVLVGPHKRARPTSLCILPTTAVLNSFTSSYTFLSLAFLRDICNVGFSKCSNHVLNKPRAAAHHPPWRNWLARSTVIYDNAIERLEVRAFPGELSFLLGWGLFSMVGGCGLE